jgi:hypothetical protein
MSIPVSRDAPCGETNYSYLKIKPLLLCENIKNLHCLTSIMLCGHFQALPPGCSQNYDGAVAFAPGCVRPPFMAYQDSSTHSTTMHLFSPLKLIERFDLGFPVLPRLLKSRRQPCGGGGLISRATTPHRLVPRIELSRVPGQGKQLCTIWYCIIMFTAYCVLYNTIAKRSLLLSSLWLHVGIPGGYRCPYMLGH